MFQYFSSVYSKAKFISNKTEADRVSLISVFPFKATGLAVHTVLSQADSRKAMGYAVVRGWRWTWRYLVAVQGGGMVELLVFSNLFCTCFLGFEGENRAMYKISKFLLHSSSFSAVRAKDQLAGTDGKGRGCVISFKK